MWTGFTLNCLVLHELCCLLICISCVDCDNMVEIFLHLSGIGQPTFSSEDSCTYVFDWETQYACIEKPASCQLLTGRHLFDLSLLMRTNNMGQTMFTYTYKYLSVVCRLQVVRKIMLANVGAILYVFVLYCIVVLL